MPDRHKQPRLAPLTMRQEEFDKLTEIADRMRMPVAWVARKLIIEGLDCIEVEKITSTWMTEGFLP